MFEGSLKLFDENVVLATASAVHADVDSVLFERAGEIVAGELSALVTTQLPGDGPTAADTMVGWTPKRLAN